jgi:site-specific DNA-cytosine methylase
MPGPLARQKLSRAWAGTRQGRATRSGTFWPFWKLMRGLTKDRRAPRAIVLENVYGCLTSREGKDFASIASALAELGYRFGAVVVDAVHFVPQSRPRVFFIAFRGDQRIPASLIAEGPQGSWHPAAIIEAYAAIDTAAKRNWIWWSMSRHSVLAVKNSREIAGTIQAYFERLQKCQRQLLGLAVEVEGGSGQDRPESRHDRLGEKAAWLQQHASAAR